MYHTIVIYDFDNTLMKTPEPDEGESIWEMKTGYSFPYKNIKDVIFKSRKNWYHHKESLDENIFNIEFNEHVKKALLDDINNPHVYTILMSGRTKNLENFIKKLLKEKGIPELNEYIFKNDKDRTLNFKLKELRRIIDNYSVKNLIMWEDRVEHIYHFQQFGEKALGKNFQLNQVDKI